MGFISTLSGLMTIASGLGFFKFPAESAQLGLSPELLKWLFIISLIITLTSGAAKVTNTKIGDIKIQFFGKKNKME